MGLHMACFHLLFIGVIIIFLVLILVCFTIKVHYHIYIRNGFLSSFFSEMICGRYELPSLWSFDKSLPVTLLGRWGGRLGDSFYFFNKQFIYFNGY